MGQMLRKPRKSVTKGGVNTGTLRGKKGTLETNTEAMWSLKKR